jgi:hypothetical protein
LRNCPELRFCRLSNCQKLTGTIDVFLRGAKVFF